MWEYQECIDAFMEEFFERKQRDNISNNEALVRTFGEFYSPNMDDEMEKAIINVLYVEIASQNSRIFIKAKENREKALKSINFEKIMGQLEMKQITKNQIDELVIRRDNALKLLNNIQVDLYPDARWYYEELINGVNQYFITIKDAKSEFFVPYVLEHFERACNNTLSEKITIYMLLGEKLVEEQKPIPYSILKELVQFNSESVTNQLLPEEKNDLESRIQKLLELNGQE
ncbi:Imm3 family immunity protein [Paenibacillus sp. DCT19]|uniref:Imm3 family immunity protein n=1 Tax=Paenibacillus sp. DCT19 TaxID=2211212 RepID=UPI000FE1A950|nr:Imm3 family immunity protein [Paenibacillus sp. DCT19]